MKTYLLKSISYIFHPLLMPLIGAVYFFSVNPILSSATDHLFLLLLIFLSIVVLPLVLYVVLKKLHIVQTIHLKTTKERILPLLLNALIMGILSFSIVPKQLYYYIIAALLTIILGLILAILKIKASIHMMALSGTLTFISLTSLHLGLLISTTVLMSVLLIGAMGASRLCLKAHTIKELYIGLIIGVFPQILLFTN